MVLAFLSTLAHQTIGMFFIPQTWPVACTMFSARIALLLYPSRSFQIVSWSWYHIRFLLIHFPISLSGLQRQTQDDPSSISSNRFRVLLVLTGM